MRVAAYVADIALNGNFNGCHYDLGSWFFGEYDAELTIKL